MKRQLGAFGIAVAALGTMVVSTANASGGDEKVTLTVGLMQDLDSPNPTAGYLVSAYELWNLQYATLTDKAADDFAIEPGLAEKWEASNDGLTYTYTLREGLQWSDGEPLTADDVAWTINTSRDQEWINHAATTANLDAKVIDDRTVLVDQANWERNRITLDTVVVDVSPKGDWSQVRVANEAGSFGRVNPVRGFIYN